MEVPRAMYVTQDGEFCEYGDVRAVMLKYPKGYAISDEEAEKSGLNSYMKDYDKEHAEEIKAAKKEERAAEKAAEKDAADAPENKAEKGLDGVMEVAAEEREKVAHAVEKGEHAAVKAVPQTAVEDKAVDEPDEEKSDTVGAHMPPDTRRIGGRRGSA